ncbi:hypothetical protein XENTR_v10017967 [Xenopus tropicalis]|uniref:Sulfotransferase n=1 Tax=Xenopus tropicalis TaxID=8364 RepID=A0A803JNL4_XENTR|nr:carbohydrate sulfotransferase 15 [Xenopus tropicalis]KAE8590172.1 hypothetical protein XENTR_v10017967 [Xenopus tropicalis]
MTILLGSSLGFRKGLGRRILCSLVFALVITALVVASYVLSGGKQDHLFQPFPSHSKDYASNYNQSEDRRQKHIALSENSVVQLTDRRIPEIEELKQYEPHLFAVIPQKFLSISQSPCWHQKYEGKKDPYSGNAYVLYAKRFRAVFEEMRQSFWKRLQVRGDSRYRLRCLPYFYIIGQPKCGTTDLYNRMRLHPSVRFSANKEPQWWTRKRFGIIRLKEALQSPFPVDDYLDLFDLAAQEIQALHNEAKDREDAVTVPLIIGEASASTMWDNNSWMYVYDNTTNTEPPHLTQDFIHAFQPNAKFIVMLRDPVERLYSDYLYFAIANKSVEEFHDKVNESLQMFESCLQMSTLRSCAYNTTLNNLLPVRLQVGLYVVFLWDWLSLYNMEQFLVLRLEDYSLRVLHSMRRVFSFLELEPLREEQEATITQSPASNSRRPEDCSLGPMYPQTKQLLRNFYRPYNQRLSQLLRDDAFLWEAQSGI